MSRLWGQAPGLTLMEQEKDRRRGLPVGHGLSWVVQPTLHPGLVVSLHDVCPATWEASRRMVEDLRRDGVTRLSLLVVPHYHRGQKITAVPEFAAWLRELVAQGHEMVLHGYFHERVSQVPLQGWQRWMASHYTAGEGEFYDLGPEEARPLLREGLQEMTTVLGFAPRGFIAPAWLLHPSLENVLLQEGLRYTTRIDGIHDFACRTFYPARSLVYSARSAWRRICSLGWNALLNAWLQEAPLLRLGLHPPDWQHAPLREQARRLAQEALVARAPLTYEAWLSAVSPQETTPPQLRIP